MARDRRHTSQSLIQDYREAARAGAWNLCANYVALLYRFRLEFDVCTEVIYADGYQREMRGDTDNARRCYELASTRGHTKALRRLTALGGPVIPQPMQRNN